MKPLFLLGFVMMLLALGAATQPASAATLDGAHYQLVAHHPRRHHHHRVPRHRHHRVHRGA